MAMLCAARSWLRGVWAWLCAADSSLAQLKSFYQLLLMQGLQFALILLISSIAPLPWTTCTCVTMKFCSRARATAGSLAMLCFSMH